MRISHRHRLAVIAGVACLIAAIMSAGGAGNYGTLSGARLVSVVASSVSRPAITTQPADQKVGADQSVSFTATASGTPLPAVRWQVSYAGGSSFTTIAGATSPTLRLKVTAPMTGNRYRAVFSNSAGKAWTRAAVLTVVAAPPGPFVEFIFSRSEITAADNCIPNSTNIARLDTVVEPYMATLGLTATGSVETLPTLQSANWCPHYRETLAASWDQLGTLGAAGWTFIDHSADYPADATTWSNMTPTEMWEETCGSAQVIDAHGLKGASDMYLWPNSSGQPGIVNAFALANFVAPCFGTSRVYGSGLTSASQFTTSPYRQSVRAVNGGACNVSSASCYTVIGIRYVTPAKIIAAIKALQPGQVLALQQYLFVTGKSPAYTSNATRWDCTNPNPDLHWSNDSERYCWTDMQQVFSYLASSGIGITQPGVVNAAMGRTAYSDTAVPDAPTGVTAIAGNSQATIGWNASPSTRAGTITGYTVTASPGGASATTPDGRTTTATVTGLTNGVTYTFTVTAASYLGKSVPSAPSNPVVPEATPTEPARRPT